ncbi:MAG: hypothetical protein U9Q74_10420, partial [Gemmatimonadota bacterium]|nr:hypothetical protein [Gemmatimonadota bacterium]
VAGDPHAGVDLPLVCASLELRGLETGRAYTLYVDHVQVHVRPRPAASVESIEVPTGLAPGERATIRARLACPNAPAEPQIDAQLLSEAGGVLVQRPMNVAADGSELLAVAQALPLPAWLPPGRYGLGLRSRNLELRDDDPVPLVAAGARVEPEPISIDATRTPPALVVGEDALAPVVHELRGQTPDATAESATLVGLPTTTDQHPFAWAPDAMRGGRFDASALDRRAAAVLNARPDAQLVLQVYADSTATWDAGHPDALQRFDDSTLAPPQVFGRRRTHPDIISPAWQRGALDRLRALVEHVEAAPWGHRVVAWELQAGDVGAWRPWGASAALGDGDTPVRERAFREWLIEHYDQDVDRFRDAWLGQRRGLPVSPGPTQPGFEAAGIPGALDARGGPEPSLYDPAIDQPMIDLLAFRAEAPARLLAEMAAVVREGTGGRPLVGACYGHMLEQSAAGDWRWPHLALTDLLGAQTLDLLTGPLTGVRASLPAFPGTSARASGGLYLHRAPQLAPEELFAAAAVSSAGVVGRSEQVASLTAPLRPSEPPAEVAPQPTLVLDDVSARYLAPGDPMVHALLAGQYASCAASGLPWRVHLLCDAVEARTSAAPLYLFADALTVEPDAGRALARNTCHDDALLVWVYGPGAVTERMITGRTMKYLTGMKLSLLASRGPVRVCTDGVALTHSGAPEGPATYGVASVWPRFLCADDRAECLGTLEGTEFCGLALRRFEDCTSVFSAAPPPSQVLRGIAARAGQRPWVTDPGPAWFGPGVVALRGDEDGTRELSLPRPATVVDALTGRTIAEGRQLISVRVDAERVRVLRLTFD